MINNLKILFAFLFYATLQAQVGINTTTPDASSILDITATDKGLLIPRVLLDNVVTTQLDGTNTAATGLMIYNTNSSVIGGSGVGYYYFNGTIWEQLITTNNGDDDWYEVGTTTSPNNISDDIFTQGNVAIGKTTADYALDVIESTEDRGINLVVNGTDNNVKSGLNTEISNSGSGIHYAINNMLTGSGIGSQYGVSNTINVSSTTSSHIGIENNLIGTVVSGLTYGVKNYITSGGSATITGIKNELLNTTSTGEKIGMDNRISGGGSFKIGVSNQIVGNTTVGGGQIGFSNYINTASNVNQYGLYNIISALTGNNSDTYGSYSIISGDGDGRHYGTYNLLNGVAPTQSHYGTYNELTGAGNGSKYGVYNLIDPTAGGFNFGVYSESLGVNSYAGFFIGNVAIGTDLSNTYTFPATRGTSGQIMMIDGSGFVSWQDNISVSDKDWFEVGTTTSPNSINDNMYTKGNVAIGKTTADYTLDIVEPLGNRGINLVVSGADNNTKYGQYIDVTNIGGGYHFGSYQNIENSGNGPHTGIFNQLGGPGDGIQNGIYNTFTNSGSGWKRGVYNLMAGSGSGARYGVANYLVGTNTGNQYAIHNTISSAGNSKIYGVYQNLNATGSGSHYGIYTRVSSGSGLQYGSYNQVTNNTALENGGTINWVDGSGNGESYGTKNSITNSGDGIHSGVINILNGSGSSFHYGVYNQLQGDGEGKQFGVHNRLYSTGNEEHYGTDNRINGVGSGSHYGTYNELSDIGTGDFYGIYNNINFSATGVGDKYGSFNAISSLAGGTHYGVYSQATKVGSYAGYFLGTMAKGTSAANMYSFPSSRGSINQVMQTDGSGNVTWADATSLPSFWKRIGTNLDVATTADDIQFSSNQTSITFPATAAGAAPMIHMFASGGSNGNRMVIAHSPSYPTYGLEYDDSSDMFRFLSSGNPVVEIDLVGGNPLRVYGTARASNFQSDTNNYPDYVFEKYYNLDATINSDYSFLSINEVENFIKENGHLPNVKPYKEIEKQGMTIDLAETSVINLEKIEELFLFVIELNNEIEDLKQQLKNQQKEIDKIKSLLINK